MKIEEILQSEFSELFVTNMKNRMVTSFFKYGYVAEAVGKIDQIESCIQRLERYRATGNIEWLVDAANMAMIEFMQPHHPQAHFRETSAKEPPGRVWQPDEFDGTVEVSARANDGTPQ